VFIIYRFFPLQESTALYNTLLNEFEEHGSSREEAGFQKATPEEEGTSAGESGATEPEAAAPEEVAPPKAPAKSVKKAPAVIDANES